MMSNGRRNIFCLLCLVVFLDEQQEEEEHFVFIEFMGLPDPSILRQKGICTVLVNKRINKIILI